MSDDTMENAVTREDRPDTLFDSEPDIAMPALTHLSDHILAGSAIPQRFWPQLQFPGAMLTARSPYSSSRAWMNCSRALWWNARDNYIIMNPSENSAPTVCRVNLVAVSNATYLLAVRFTGNQQGNATTLHLSGPFGTVSQTAQGLHDDKVATAVWSATAAQVLTMWVYCTQASAFLRSVHIAAA